MLVLNRRSKQSIKIGDDVEIKVLEICESHVKLGILAPKNISIVRSEIKGAVDRCKQATKVIYKRKQIVDK